MFRNYFELCCIAGFCDVFVKLKFVYFQYKKPLFYMKKNHTGNVKKLSELYIYFLIRSDSILSGHMLQCAPHMLQCTPPMGHVVTFHFHSFWVN